MADVLASVGLLIGSGFVLLAAVGVLRMPDFYLRAHAATKAGALGSAVVVLSMAASVGGVSLVVRSAITVVFILLTAPVAVHVLGRAVYRGGS